MTNKHTTPHGPRKRCLNCGRWIVSQEKCNNEKSPFFGETMFENDRCDSHVRYVPYSGKCKAGTTDD